MITYSKNYPEFIAIITEKKLKIHKVDEKSSAYHLVARDGIIFYQTYVVKDGGPEQLDYETNYLPTSLTSFPDGKVPVIGGIGLFTKPYTNIIVLTKNEYGDPVNVKSVNDGVDSQLVTIIYDDDGDFQAANVSDY